MPQRRSERPQINTARTTGCDLGVTLLQITGKSQNSWLAVSEPWRHR